MNKKYHFIAIGGIGMSGLAKFLLENGYEVSGSDINDSKYIDKLRDLGAKVYIGHDADNVPQDCVIVASTAIRENNPELVRAKEMGLPIYHRSDLLAEISKMGKFFIGYSGTHGKTTTSGLASYVLEKGGLEPSYVVGGIIPDIGTNAQSKDSKFFCAELDESDGTIVKYSPNVVVINNLEADHIDFYKEGLKSILVTFKEFLKNLSKEAKVLANVDCSGVSQLLREYPEKEFITYSLEKDADYTAKNIEFCEDFTAFDVYYKGVLLTELNIVLRGKHNVYNALAVLASLHQAGVDIDKIKAYFSEFTGMGRRFQKVGEFGGIMLFDDYAHHPTEIKATLSSVSGFKNKNVIAVFQPHRYTRLKNLWDEFMDSFGGVDKVIVTDVYSASEDEIEGINSENFVKELSNKLTIPCENISGNMETVAKRLFPTLKPNDVVIGLGAGTITALGKELLKLNEEMTKVVS